MEVVRKTTSNISAYTMYIHKITQFLRPKSNDSFNLNTACVIAKSNTCPELPQKLFLLIQLKSIHSIN